MKLVTFGGEASMSTASVRGRKRIRFRGFVSLWVIEFVWCRIFHWSRVCRLLRIACDSSLLVLAPSFGRLSPSFGLLFPSFGLGFSSSTKLVFVSLGLSFGYVWFFVNRSVAIQSWWFDGCVGLVKLVNSEKFGLCDMSLVALSGFRWL